MGRMGTALKPAWEPIILARKPLIGTVAQNVLKYGTGAINIDVSRVEGFKPDTIRGAGGQNGIYSQLSAQGRIVDDGKGRWPANLIHDGSEEVLGTFPTTTTGDLTGKRNKPKTKNAFGQYASRSEIPRHGDTGSAARFFYCAKASPSERGKENTHPTVKPQALMRYLCKLVTSPGGIVLDPFMGSGSTGLAARHEGFEFVGIEKELEYYTICQNRLKVEIKPKAASLEAFFA